jgi:hypothetical protein
MMFGNRLKSPRQAQTQFVPMRNEQEGKFWNAVIVSGITLFILISILFIFFGEANADEGWYLYASKLVFEGQHPYRDFAFTQTPLLPYIYGIAQTVFHPSMYLGRITSAILSTIAFIFSWIAAGNFGGKMARRITLLLGVTFTYGIYYQAIIKTYALTTLFLTLAFFVLSLNSRKDVNIILASLFVLLATLTRLSAGLFAIPFLLYAFFASNPKIKIIILALCLAAFSWVFYLAFPNIDAAVWGLVAYHSSRWGNTPVAGQITQILFSRIPQLLQAFPSYVLLYATIIILGFRQIKIPIHRTIVIFVPVIGLCLFAIPNLISGEFYIEYFVPAIFLSFPIAGIAMGKIFQQKSKYPNLIMNVVLLSALALGILRGGSFFIDSSGGRAPVEEIRQVSAVVSKNSAPDDKLFVLQALWIAIESRREVMPNMTMAQFSFSDFDTITADHLRLINGPIAWSDIENSIPKMVILTDLDLGILQKSPYYEKIVVSIEKNYRLLCTEDNFGQQSGRIYVYIRRQEN